MATFGALGVTAEPRRPQADRVPLLPQKFELVPVEKISSHPENARKSDLGVIQQSIERNGFFGACIVQRSTGHILVGTHRWLAARELGEEAVPVLWIDVDDDRARRIMLADNRIAELSSWDEDALLEALRVLEETDAEGLLGTGFNENDLDTLQRALDARSIGSMDYDEAWQASGMPAYQNDDERGAFKTTVHFATDADAEAFFKLLGKAKERAFWWPEPDGFIGCHSDLRVVNGAEEEA